MGNDIIYQTEIRRHTDEYPYRIIIKNNGKGLLIAHQYIKDGQGKHILTSAVNSYIEGQIENGSWRWETSHSIGIKKRDLTKILESLGK